MSQVTGGDPTHLDALAAEYVLGTLDPDERNQARILLTSDENFAARVKLWERRLGELHLMVEPVEPDGRIWQRIKAKMPEVVAVAEVQQAELEPPSEPPVTEPEPEPEPTPEQEPEPAQEPQPSAASAAPAQAAAAMPSDSFEAALAAVTEPLPPPEPSAPVPPPAEAVPRTLVAPALSPATATPAEPPSAPGPVVSEVISHTPPIAAPAREIAAMRRRLRRWRAFATLMTLAVLAVAALVGAWRYAPDRVPPMLQPAEVMQRIGVNLGSQPAPAPAPRPPPPSEYDE
jgi:anti-sigma-K factor RskA